MALCTTSKLPSDMLKEGQTLYRQSKYQEAVQCFSQIVSRNDGLLFVALDNRASSYIKLGNFKSALRDGRRMIKEDKANPAGYLRAGKALQQLGEVEPALKIYIYGIDNVPTSDSNFKLLEKTYDNTIKSSKAMDPLKILPLELATIIIKFLSFPNIVILLRVSKLWYSLLSSISVGWSHLDFSKTDKQVPIASIRQYVQRSRGSVTQTIIHFSRRHHLTALGYIISKCKVLNYIEILSGFPTFRLVEVVSSSFALKTLIFSTKCEINLNLVYSILDYCQSLDRAEFHNCKTWEGELTARDGHISNLRSLIANVGRAWPYSGSQLNLPVLLEKIPKAQNLSLKGWSWGARSTTRFDFSSLKNLRSLDMTGSEYIDFPLLPASVETLNLSGCLYSPMGETMSKANFEACHLPVLTSLSVANFYKIDAKSLISLLKPNQGQLKTLNIKGCHSLSVMDHIDLIEEGFLDKVTHLGLGFFEAGDEIMRSLASKLEYLKVLDIENASITGFGLKALTLGEYPLERLILNHCSSVSRDAIEHVRSQGVFVHTSHY